MFISTHLGRLRCIGCSIFQSQWCIGATLIILIVTSVSSSFAQDALVIRTDSLEVTFSKHGAFPEKWDITAPEFVPPNEKIELIHQPKTPESYSHPLKLEIDGPDGDLTKWTNTTEYSVVEQKDQFIHDGKTSNYQIDFESSIHPTGLRILKSYRFVNRYEVHLRVRVYKESAKFKVSDITVSLGESLGGDGESIEGFGGWMFSYTEPVMCTNGKVSVLEEDGFDEPIKDNSFAWIAIHNRFHMLSVSPIVAGSWQSISGEIRTADFPEVLVRPGVQGDENYFEFELAIYFGPKDVKHLREVVRDRQAILHHTLPGWMSWIVVRVRSAVITLAEVSGS